MGKVSKQLSNSKKIASYVKDKTKCFYCGELRGKTEADHVVARSKGGVTVIPACRSCNASKNDKPLMVWLRDVKKKDKEKWGKMCTLHKRRTNIISRKIQKVRDEK